ncbi:hypothetical protein F4X33_00085 [Candidatus Poribacteria bacterium]|nr:hypothetical protein [Candidatus Poribacteria bacterium]
MRHSRRRTEVAGTVTRIPLQVARHPVDARCEIDHELWINSNLSHRSSCLASRFRGGSGHPSVALCAAKTPGKGIDTRQGHQSTTVAPATLPVRP